MRTSRDAEQRQEVAVEAGIARDAAPASTMRHYVVVLGEAPSAALAVRKGSMAARLSGPAAGTGQLRQPKAF